MARKAGGMSDFVAAASVMFRGLVDAVTALYDGEHRSTTRLSESGDFSASATFRRLRRR